MIEVEMLGKENKKRKKKKESLDRSDAFPFPPLFDFFFFF